MVGTQNVRRLYLITRFGSSLLVILIRISQFFTYQLLQFPNECVFLLTLLLQLVLLQLLFARQEILHLLLELSYLPSVPFQLRGSVSGLMKEDFLSMFPGLGSGLLLQVQFDVEHFSQEFLLQLLPSADDFLALLFEGVVFGESDQLIPPRESLLQHSVLLDEF